MAAALENPIDDEGEDPASAVAPTAEAVDKPAVTAGNSPAASLSLTEAELAAVDELILREGAPDRTRCSGLWS
jgi:hypothetical protein